MPTHPPIPPPLPSTHLLPSFMPIYMQNPLSQISAAAAGICTVFLIITSLTGVRWNLTVVFIFHFCDDW